MQTFEYMNQSINYIILKIKISIDVSYPWIYIIIKIKISIDISYPWIYKEIKEIQKLYVQTTVARFSHISTSCSEICMEFEIQ